MDKKLIIGLIALTMFVGSASAFSIPFVDSGQQSSPPTSVQECQNRDDCTVADNQTDITVQDVRTGESQGIFGMFASLIGFQDADTFDDEVTEGENVEVETDVKVTWSGGTSGDWLYLTDSFYVLIDNRNDESELGIGSDNAETVQVYYDDYTNIDYEFSTENWYSSYPPSHKGWLSSMWLEIGGGGNTENVGEVAFNVLPDQDGDGVADQYDECPETAGDEDTDGCPDSDGDGIKDSEDDCPDVEGDESANGCPDSDGDGYLDSPYGNDQCPTVSGSNSNGCPTVYYQQADSCVSANLNDVSDSTKTYDSQTACQSDLPEPEEICGDGIDNDNDGQVDENCGDNQTDPNEEICGDGIDNDGDGKVDENCGDDPDNLFDSEALGIGLLALVGMFMTVIYFNA